jgi:hypothetical protein
MVVACKFSQRFNIKWLQMIHKQQNLWKEIDELLQLSWKELRLFLSESMTVALALEI